MKKLLALFISILLVFSLCCCGQSTTQNTPDNIPTGNETIENGSGEISVGDEKHETQNPNNTPTNQTPPNENTTPEENNPTVTPPNEEQIIEIPEIVSDHTALKRENYYQYSFLNDTEKKVYNEFYAAAEKCASPVDLAKYKLTNAAVKKIYEAFCADCPQFFYISKQCTFVIDSNSQKVTEFIIQYTDGTIIDSYDEDGKKIKLADRQKIQNQINEFNNKISAILSYIPSNVPEITRERKIYDYISKTVIYDHDTETASKNNTEILSTSFSSYGAACKGKAVCEGYVKLFQILCYNVGINATPVESDETMQHMWSAVLIDSKWYMCDITWDDSDNHLTCLYKYFNVTTEFISLDHSFGNTLKVPNCTSTDAAFYKNFALIPNGTQLPNNYKELIYDALVNADEFIYIYRGDNAQDLKNFVNSNLNKIDEFLKTYGYITGDEYYHTNSYYYIPIIKK